MQICWNRFWKILWKHINYQVNLFLAGFSHLKPLCSNLQLPKKHLLLLLLQPRETPLWKTEKKYLIIWKISPNKSLKLFVCLLDLQFRSRFLCTCYMFGSVWFRFGKQNLDVLVRFRQNGKTLLWSVTTALSDIYLGT